jgi:hypothetical protein
MYDDKTIYYWAKDLSRGTLPWPEVHWAAKAGTAYGGLEKIGGVCGRDGDGGEMLVSRGEGAPPHLELGYILPIHIRACPDSIPSASHHVGSSI